MYRKEIHEYIRTHEDKMLEDIKTLIRINSERMEAEEGKPFGKGAVEVLDKAEEICASYGFDTKNWDNYVITVDLNEKERGLDILAHLDVVPSGDGWTVTEPFEPLVKDGKIYGRGSSDDKGPAIAALYAMRAIKELNIPIKSGVRLILGTDEECLHEDIHYYYNKNEKAPMTISPDAHFPLINIEKGRFFGEFSASYEIEKELPRIHNINSGVKINVVPNKADAKIEGMTVDEVSIYAKEAESRTNLKFIITEEDNLVVIHAKGEAGHAAAPTMGNNALTGLLDLLSALPLAETKANNLIRSISKILPHGDYYGKALGINLEDEISGKTTVSFDLFQMNETGLSGNFDCRSCVLANEENTTEVVKKVYMEHGLTPGNLDMLAPHYIPEDSELVQALLTSYRELTGRDEKPLAIGGGTYVHGIANGVAFGCGVPEVDNHAHGLNEFMVIEQLLLSAEIFADAIIRLCS